VNRLAALIYDRYVMGPSQQAGLVDARRDALAGAHGEVLEIGTGTGLNLEAYPREGITRLVLSEPHEPMRRQIEGKLASAPAPVEIVDAGVERLPFEDASFDTVTATLVLCETGDPAAALDEIARVLKPGGRFLFLEHVRSADPELARRQDRWAPVWRFVAGGCNCNRDTLATIAASGLDVERHSLGRFPKAPRIVSPLLSGAAVRGDVL